MILLAAALQEGWKITVFAAISRNVDESLDELFLGRLVAFVERHGLVLGVVDKCARVEARSILLGLSIAERLKILRNERGESEQFVAT